MKKNSESQVKGKSMGKEALKIIEEFRRAIAEIGPQFTNKQLAEKLNSWGVVNTKGTPFTPESVRNVCVRKQLLGDDAKSPPVASATQRTLPEERAEVEKQDDATQCTTDIPQPEMSLPEKPKLDPDTIAALKEVAEWWKRTRGGEIPNRGVTGHEETREPAYRPSFPGKRRNTGIRINERLRKAALGKAQIPKEAIKTGGGLSPLIEYLLWGYLGFDPKFLQT
jgi:hypothetical protein